MLPWRGYDMKERLTKHFDIRFSHCDRNGRLALHELFKMMQECAVLHAHELGVGMQRIAVTNQTFVLSRAVINILGMPSMDERIEITTYPAGIERLFFIRDFEMHCNGRLFASARTLWLVIDIASRRPDRNLARQVDFPFNTNDSLGLVNPEKPGVPAKTEPVFVSRVRYSDIDILGHANNSAYIRWTVDCLGEEFFRSNERYSMTVCFSSEMTDGEVLEIFHDDNLIMGRGSEGRETFRV
ncbi:MAG TPA: thioesterase, partial [Clostridia bacterium]|nr:thioesterase [Clostridia bacterium]